MSNRIAGPGTAGLLMLALVVACRPDPRVSPGKSARERGDEPRIDETTPTETKTPTRPPGAIYRSELRRATQDGSSSYLVSQLRPEPYRPQGRFEGWIITAVWPKDPELCEPGCDLQIGDVILEVNGSKLAQPEDLADAMSSLDTLEVIELRGLRDGQYFERSHPILAEQP